MRISDWSSDVCSSDVFPERALEPLAKARILENPAEVVRRAPDIILGSWCGQKFRPEKVAARPGWDAIPAVRDGQLHEIKIGRASCRERVCQYDSISVGAVTLNKKKKHIEK